MIKNIFKSVFLLFLVFSFLACSSGGRSYTKTPLCKSTDDPINAEKMTSYKSKVELKAGDSFANADEYTYQGSEVYFWDKDQDIKLYLSQSVKNGGKDSESSVLCIAGRGLNKDMKKIEIEVPIVSQLIISATGRTRIKQRLFKLIIDPKPKIDFSFAKEDSGEIESDPLNEYKQFASQKHFFLGANEKDLTSYKLVSQIENFSTHNKDRKTPDTEIRIMVNYKASKLP